MNKKYTRKQRGGDIIGTFAITSASIAALSFLIYELINMGQPNHVSEKLVVEEINRVLVITNSIIGKPPTLTQINIVMKASKLSPTPITEQQIKAILNELTKRIELNKGSSGKYPDLKDEEILRILELSKKTPEKKAEIPEKMPTKKAEIPAKMSTKKEEIPEKMPTKKTDISKK